LRNIPIRRGFSYRKYGKRHGKTRSVGDDPAIGLLSQVVARQYIEAGLLAQLPLSLPDPQRPIGVTWNRHKPLSAAVQSFMRCLRVSAQQLTA
jgi:DNA-binding transcriptional LysR family regulator